MAHIKVWLVVGLTVAVAGMAWYFPTDEARRVEQVQEQLVPLQKSRALHQRIHKYQQKLLARVKRIARHKKIKSSLQPIAELPASQRWGWRERQAHRQSLKNLTQHAALLEKASKYKKIYIFSKHRRLLVAKGKVLDFQSQENSMSHLPMVNAALQGQPQSGLWSHNKKSYFMVSAPVYGKAKDDDDENKRPLVGAVLVTQSISSRLFYDWGWKKENKNAPLLMLFSQEHPLLYKVPGSKQPEASAKATPPSARGKLDVKTGTPLEQAFKHWSARRFASLVRMSKQGMYTSSHPIQLKGKPYYYAVGQIPASVNDGKVGYVMLSPVVRASVPFYSSQPFLVAASATLIALLLGIWFSLGWSSDRKRLQILLTDMQADPASLKSVKQLPSSFVFLFQYLRPLARRLLSQPTESVTNTPMPAQSSSVPSAPEKEEREMVSIGAPAVKDPKNTVEAIRALSADGSIKLPQRPKGMTYIQGGTKEPVEANPLSMLQEEARESDASNPLPSFISSNEADNIVRSQPESGLADLLSSNPSSSSTPLPKDLGLPMANNNDLGLPLASPPMGSNNLNVAGVIDDQPEGLSLPFQNSEHDDDLFAGLSIPGEENEELHGVQAASLPLSSNTQSPANMGLGASPLSTFKASMAHEPTATSMPEPKEATASKLPIVGNGNALKVEEKKPVGHLNLTSELDNVFSALAGPMTPAPPSAPVESAPSISLPSDSSTQYPMDEVRMRQVFQDYLDMRKSCGESTQNIQWDSFVELLRNQKASILQQYSCRDVQFYVQEKDGRASLKATPVK
ncbi:MAG: hypothetical protein EP343_17620 [Deltaproteobacteria bacterium]|nr:MAG: hypothetical protein EP343_17620 [Deltaproteobacteria bacterium]